MLPVWTWPYAVEAGDRGHLPLEVEHVGRGARGVDRRVGDGREGRALGAGGEVDTALTAYVLDAPAPLVGRDPRREVHGVLERGQPEGDVGRAATDVLLGEARGGR